jgi:hypothetical protein
MARSGYGNDFYAREFWRFVMVQQYVEKLALTADRQIVWRDMRKKVV